MLNMIRENGLIVSLLALILIAIMSTWLLKLPMQADTADSSDTVTVPETKKLLHQEEDNKTATFDTAPIIQENDERSNLIDETEEEIKLPANERLKLALLVLSERLDENDSEFKHPMLGVDDTNIILRHEISSALKENPTLIDELLKEFVHDPNSALSREIAAVISETASAKAQTVALEIAIDNDNYNQEQRASALLMIAGMDSISSETRDGLLDNIQQETDSELTQYSLMALKSAPSTQEDYERVHEVLQTTAISSDENIRRHAAYQIGEWALTDADLDPLRTLATQDDDANTRVRAIQSLGETSFKSDDNKAVLWAAANDDQEYAPTRQQAWEALQSYPLNDSERISYEEIGRQIQADLEVFLINQ